MWKARRGTLTPVAARGGGTTALSPITILGAKLLAWYDAKNSGSITQSGGTVSAWNDLSGNGYHLVQATGARQPTYNATGFGASNPSLTFLNATQQWMRVSGIALGGTKVTAACVASQDAGSVSYLRLSSIVKVGTVQNDFSHAENACLFIANTQTSLEGFRGGLDLSAGAISVSTRFRAISAYDGTNHTMTIDGSVASSVGSTGTFGASQVLFLGAGAGATSDATATDFWTGKIGTFVLANDELTVGEKSDLDAYLAAW